MNNPKSSNRLTIIVVALLFAAPVLLTTLMHSQWWSYKPASTRNFGELLQPPVAIQGWPDTSSNLDIEDQSPIWTLLLHSDAGCADDCQEQLTWLRQVRAAQGRHSHQVAIQLAGTAGLSDSQQLAVAGIYPELQQPDAAQLSSLQLAISQLQPPDTENQLMTYLIDPAGFIILRYPENSDATGIRKDLGRLLTWSNKARGNR